MTSFFKRATAIVIFFFLIITNVYGVIAPVKKVEKNSVILLSSEEIKLVFEQIDLYHHPLGIWLVEYQATLQNTRAQSVSQPVGFPSGFDVRMIEGNLYCDYFEKFQVFVNNKKIKKINFLVKCPNYVETTDTEWSMDDDNGIGFLNTWKINFKPEEEKTIKITFCFIVTKPPLIYDSKNKETWYVESMNWIKADYSSREQNQFKLPLSLGSFWAFYPDSILIRTYLAKEWVKIVEKTERSYEDKFITRYEFSEPFGFYSPTEIYLTSPTIDQLQNMSKTELKLLKNSFFAKFGRPFKNATLKLFFTHQPWYSENPNYNNWYLTDWDIDNIKSVHKFKKQLK
ncbi:MAG: YARHG domain-containing protein [Bacteroidales bacterium]|nr:YARHG domain-containing protein [Bacteroidales bacterium]